jgi:hypothetical protein
MLLNEAWTVVRATDDLNLNGVAHTFTKEAALAARSLAIEVIVNAHRPEPASTTKMVVCRGCGKELHFDGIPRADGCPCNSPRGINHGIVPPYLCACKLCRSERDR